MPVTVPASAGGWRSPPGDAAGRPARDHRDRLERLVRSRRRRSLRTARSSASGRSTRRVVRHREGDRDLRAVDPLLADDAAGAGVGLLVDEGEDGHGVRAEGDFLADRQGPGHGGGPADDRAAGIRRRRRARSKASADSLRGIAFSGGGNGRCRRLAGYRLRRELGLHPVWATRIADYNPRTMPIYLDHAATTPLRPEVLEAMLPYLGGTFGNPSSPHAWGRVAREALDDAHERLARAIGGRRPRDRVHERRHGGAATSRSRAPRGPARRAATGSSPRPSSTTPSATRSSTSRSSGSRSSRSRSTATGGSTRSTSSGAITDRTILVTVMLANNEVGTLQPIAEIAGGRPRAPRGCCSTSTRSRRRRGSTSTSTTLGADLVALAAHKAEGPKGTGALWIRRGTHILAQQHGGSQERHRRAGTENVAGAVGMATAFELRRAERASDRAARCARCATGSRRAVLAVDGVELTGHPVERLPHIASVIVARGRRRVDRPRAGPRGHRRLDRVGLHERLDRGQPRADRDGLPGRRGARRAAPVARPDDHGRRDRRGGGDRARGASSACAPRPRSARSRSGSA